MNFHARIGLVGRYLKKSGLDAIVIDNPLNIFYLTGLELSVGALLITQRAARLVSRQKSLAGVLVVDNRYMELSKKQSPVPVIQSEPGWLSTLLKKRPFSAIATLGFDSENTSYERYCFYRKELDLLKKESEAKRKIRFRPLHNPIRSLRAVKDPQEIEALRAAAILGSEGYDFVCSLIKRGITELEAARQLEIFWKQKGSYGLAFDSIIAFGANSSMPHYRPSMEKLKKGDAILIDIGVNLNHYQSDMTRVPFYGKPSRQMEKIYRVVLEAQEAAIALCAPGVMLAEVDAAARGCIARHGYEKQFFHSLGHGIGLEVHEHPFFKGCGEVRLEEGMAITIEPGIYLPGIGGVRIEDTLLITKNGHENLTKRSKDLRIL